MCIRDSDEELYFLFTVGMLGTKFIFYAFAPPSDKRIVQILQTFWCRFELSVGSIKFVVFGGISVVNRLKRGELNYASICLFCCNFRKCLTFFCTCENQIIHKIKVEENVHIRGTTLFLILKTRILIFFNETR